MMGVCRGRQMPPFSSIYLTKIVQNAAFLASLRPVLLLAMTPCSPDVSWSIQSVCSSRVDLSVYVGFCTNTLKPNALWVINSVPMLFGDKQISDLVAACFARCWVIMVPATLNPISQM